MKYLVVLTTTLLVFLGFKNYENTQKITALTDTVSKIKEIITPKEPELIAIGTTIPDFSLSNAENEKVSSDTFDTAKNKVFVFSAKGCPYCEQYYDELAIFSKEHKDIPLIVFQNGASVEENKAFLEENNYTFEMLDGTDEVYREYMISGTPTTIVVDANNKVVKAGYFSTAKEIEAVL